MLGCIANISISYFQGFVKGYNEKVIISISEIFIFLVIGWSLWVVNGVGWVNGGLSNQNGVVVKCARVVYYIYLYIGHHKRG